jgi:hypothetical protein
MVDDAFMVPTQHQNEFKLLRDLDDDSAQVLLDGVLTAPAARTIEDLATWVDAQNPVKDSVRQPSSEGLLFAVGGLRRLVSLYGRDPSDLADLVARSKDLGKSSAKARERLRARLLSLLTAEPLTRVVTALDLKIEQERRFLGARVITEIRPIFRDDVSGPPAAALIASTLRLEYSHADGTSGVVFLTLDDDDLDRLGHIVDRAKQKSASLSRYLESVSLPRF